MMRRSILRMLPAEELSANFHKAFGRPSKELYAVCGLMLLAEFKDRAVDETAEAWCLNAGVQYALNLPRDRQSLCPRTVDNYQRLLRKSELAQAYDHGEEALGIITACIPQNVGESVSAAVEKIHQQQERMGTVPESMPADGVYGSQPNVEASAARGVTLIAPAAGRPKTKPDTASTRPLTPLELRRAEE